MKDSGLMKALSPCMRKIPLNYFFLVVNILERYMLIFWSSWLWQREHVLDKKSSQFRENDEMLQNSSFLHQPNDLLELRDKAIFCEVTNDFEREFALIEQSYPTCKL